MKLSLNEIKDGDEFEDLVGAYFNDLKKDKDTDITDVVVDPSGKGSDGGRDIIVTFQFYDSIITYKRKWVIQCKFRNDAISKTHLSTVNIPTLIHEYGANGYLLVCKKNASSRVTDMFENLRTNCKFNYNYVIWSGNELCSLLQIRDNVLRQYFPKYYKFTKRKDRKSKK